MVGVCLCLFLCVNTKDGFAALMIASQNGHTATAQLLVEAGANKEAKNKVRDCARDAFANRPMVSGGGSGVEGAEEGVGGTSEPPRSCALHVR